MSFTFDQANVGLNAPSASDPYEPSIASSAPSSQFSVFSDTGSSQSSVASSISDDFRNHYEETRDRLCAQAHLQQQVRASYLEQLKASSVLVPQQQQQPPQQQQQQNPATYAHVTSIPPEQRQHPRRCSLARNQKPPPLVRQCERKTHFVDNLVDSATQMVEVIWPLSTVPCRGEAGSGGRGVLPLRTYIEETLRRSRTSYSTLQVALYYLVLIKPHIPKADFVVEQETDCAALRALMCGRRMFLASLILASKYLQDRNYSAKAWSKMSGLKVGEINSNERTFLAKVNWKLHIPETVFKRWTDVVLRFTPIHLPSSMGGSTAFGCNPTPSWKQIIPLLTPELEKLPMPKTDQKPNIQCPGNFGFGEVMPLTAARNTLVAAAASGSTSQESTPTPASIAPRFLESTSGSCGPPTPGLARLGPLPTPQMTPSSVASNTPAASACGSRRPSICSAMAFAQQSNINRCTMDAFPTDMPRFIRRPSITSSISGSSPESMVSDSISASRSSRSSSISSTISSVSSAPSAVAPQQRACLARQATCRNAGLPVPPPLPICIREEREKEDMDTTMVGSATKPIMIVEDSDAELTCSPDFANFSISETKLHAPHKHSRSAHHAAQLPGAASSAALSSAASHGGDHSSINSSNAGKGRKRARPRGGRRSDLQEECRLLLEEELHFAHLDDEGEDVSMSSSSPPLERESFAAADRATAMLLQGLKHGHPTGGSRGSERVSASSDGDGSGRFPVMKNEGKKRTCCASG